MTKGKIWYVVLEGKADGPHTQEEIIEDLEKGKLGYSDLAFRPGFSRWVALGECKEFERRATTAAQTPSSEKFSPPSPDLVGESEKAWVILVKQKGDDGDSHYVQSGPFSMEQIRKKIEKGEVRYDDHVWRKDFNNWKVLKTVEEFERRIVLPPIEKVKEPTNVVPEPEIKLEAPSEMKTKVDIQSPVETITTKKEKIQVQSEEENHISDDDIDFIKKKKPKRRLMIAGVSAALGMALTYAGINAYNENLEKTAFSEKAREVASVRPPATSNAAPAQAPAAPGIVAVSKPEAKSQAVNPELENPLPHKPSVLKVVSLKTMSDHPQVVLETDLPGGAQIQVEVSARGGSILKYPSFDLVKKVNVHPGQLPTVDFTADRLPAGDYKLTVKAGELETTTPFAVGEHNADFQKKLKAFKVQIAEQRRKEQQGLNSGLEFVTKSYTTMTKSYRKARSSSSIELKKKWANQIKAWRKDFDKQASALKHIDEKNKNFFVYPNELIKLKALEDKLLDVAQLYDKSLKTGRSIASENDMDQTFQEALDDMKISMRKVRRSK